MATTLRRADQAPVTVPSVDRDSVVLDIGGAVGALVLYASRADTGREIELYPLAGGAPVHNVVRERIVGDLAHYAAIFPCLVGGTYVTDPAPRRHQGVVVEVIGGAVTQALWAREPLEGGGRPDTRPKGE